MILLLGFFKSFLTKITEKSGLRKVIHKLEKCLVYPLYRHLKRYIWGKLGQYYTSRYVIYKHELMIILVFLEWINAVISHASIRKMETILSILREWFKTKVLQGWGSLKVGEQRSGKLPEAFRKPADAAVRGSYWIRPEDCSAGNGCLQEDTQGFCFGSKDSFCFSSVRSRGSDSHWLNLTLPYLGFWEM